MAVRARKRAREPEAGKGVPAAGEAARGSEATGRLQEFFMNDHREIDAIFQKAVAAPLEQAEPLFSEFRKRLERHIRWEEEVLFPAAEARSPFLGAGPSHVMRAEHREIRSLLENIQGRLAGAELSGAHDLMLVLRSVLAEHNGKEEKIYYPESESSISAEEWAELRRRIAQIG